MKKTDKKPRQVVSIRWKLIVYFAIFMAIALLVMWVFQVYLLNNFYELIKRREMVRSAQALSLHVEKEDLAIHAYDQALDGVMTVAVYRFEDGKATQVANVDATGQAGIALPEQQLDQYYRKAAENGGNFTGKFTFGGLEVKNNKLPLFTGKGGEDTVASRIRLVHLLLVEGENGSVYMLILIASMQPLSSTVQILRTQFIWISTILLICASIMVFYLYRHISSPLVRMNE